MKLPWSKKDDAEVVVDLDELLEKPIAVKVMGERHTVRPITTAEFFATTNALARLRALVEKDSITGKQVSDAYFEVFHPLIPTLTRKTIGEMSPVMQAGLLSTIVSRIGGETYKLAEAQKKSLLEALEEKSA